MGGWGGDIKLKRDLSDELRDLEGLEQIQPLSSTQLARRSSINTKLLELYARKEDFWHQRASTNWLLKRDENSTFFYRIANGKRRKHLIFSLTNEDEIIQGTENLLQHVTDFYKQLFGPADGFGCRLRDEMWTVEEQLTTHDNDLLDQAFSAEEVKNIVDSMKPNKAPGPDGIPIEFYQQCWGIIKTDLLAAFTDFHQGTLNLNRVNYGVITLLPKGDDADRIQKYRPICLLKVLFKMFTKGMTLRLGPLMPKMISPGQNAFIKGRNVMDGVMSLQEILRETKFRKQQGIVLKLDFEKAYDKVYWQFLFHCLQRMNFSPLCLKWFNSIIRGGILCVKVNDVMGRNFGSFKGVR